MKFKRNFLRTTRKLRENKALQKNKIQMDEFTFNIPNFKNRNNRMFPAFKCSSS